MERNSDDFYKWLVGMTDGDGCFSVYYSKNKVSLIYKISLSTYNLRGLLFIKKHLGVGTIFLDKTNNMGSFTIRNLKLFESVIFPIFDKYPLLTHKYFDYLRLKKVYTILTNPFLNKTEKHLSVLDALSQTFDPHCISPIWNTIPLPITNSLDAKKVMSKAWLVGFCEAEASFYITKKDKDRYSHGFGITQKLDFIVLEAIRHILHISTLVRFRHVGLLNVLSLHDNTHFPKSTFYILDTTNKRAISNICKYFQGNLKTVKSLEFKIWKKSFDDLESSPSANMGHSKDFSLKKQALLLKTQTFLRNLRQKTPKLEK